MIPVAIGTTGIGLLVLLFLLRMPVAFAMLLIGTVGFAYLTTPKAALGLLAGDIFERFTSYPLTVIPMFILMGSLSFASGISRRLYETAYAWAGHLRGGLTMATVIACAGFAAICGSTSATAATMGRIALPEMKKYNYDDSLATGCVAASGSLGILIPPSTLLLLYGILTEESIGKLFLAGILPGLLLSLLFVITVAVICSRNPALGPPGTPTSWAKRIRALVGLSDTIILFSVSIGGLFLGFFSPTQAGGIGAGGALLIGLARRQLTWKAFVEACKDAVRTSCMVMFLIVGATIIGRFMAVSKIPFMLVNLVEGLPLPRTAILGSICLFYFLGGFFMDALALVILTIAIVYPVVIGLGFDPIWFGVIVVLVCEMGVITPPVGINVFVIKGIAVEVRLETIFKGIFPFLIALLICTLILFAFPQIATFLPSFASY
jgi:tripartite ATP-independent transporter DctM subunit